MREGKPYDEKRALELLAQSSEYAFTQIFDHYRPRIYRFAVKFLESTELAEEVIQEVFLKVWAKREHLQEVKNFEAYIITMAKNIIFDSLRKMAEEATAKAEYAHSRTPENNTENLVLEKQYEEILNNVVNLLPPQQKTVFQMAKVEGLSHEAIAEQLKLSRATVKSHMARALQTIRMHLSHHISSLAYLSVLAEVFSKSQP